MKRFGIALICVILSISNALAQDIDSPETSSIPGRPVIEDFELLYDDYDFLEHDFVNLRFSCKIKIPQADKIAMLVTNLEEWNVSIVGNVSIEERNIYMKDMGITPASETFIINDEDCYVGDLIWFQGYNRYGLSQESDSIFINDYITDPEILDDLKMLTQIQTPTTDVNEILSWGQGYVSVNSASCDRIQIFNPQGILVREAIRPQVGNRFELRRGIYVVKAFCKGICYTKNIII